MNIIAPVFDHTHPTWNSVDYDAFTGNNQELIARAMERVTPQSMRFRGWDKPPVRGRDMLKPDGIPMRAYHSMKPSVIYTAREVAAMVDCDQRFISDSMRALIAREMCGKVQNYCNGVNGYYRITPTE